MEKGQQPWTVVTLLKAAAEHFHCRGISEARLSAELLLAHVLGMKRIDLYLNHDRLVAGRELEAFRDCCRQRLRFCPVQYITGEQFFFGNRFSVDERVLIPRPETELVVEHLLERAAGRSIAGEESAAVLDIGTGSGCIAVTLAMEMAGAVITAVDVSSEALRVARENAAMHGVSERIAFLEADALAATFARDVPGPFAMIIANPPYIPEKEWAGLQEEVRLYEPKLALVAQEGFEYYRGILTASRLILKNGGLLCFELHADAAEVVFGLMRDEGFTEIMLVKDYGGFDRALSGIMNR
jgi:release factor glutamine methyltransferase